MINLLRPLAAALVAGAGTAAGLLGYNALQDGPPQGQLICEQQADGTLDCKFPETPFRDLPKEGER